MAVVCISSPLPPPLLQERVGNVEKQKAELQLQQAFLQQGGEAEATAAAASAPVVSEGPTVFTGGCCREIGCLDMGCQPMAGLQLVLGC